MPRKKGKNIGGAFGTGKGKDRKDEGGGSNSQATDAQKRTQRVEPIRAESNTTNEDRSETPKSPAVTSSIASKSAIAQNATRDKGLVGSMDQLSMERNPAENSKVSSESSAKQASGPLDAAHHGQESTDLKGKHVTDCDASSSASLSLTKTLPTRPNYTGIAQFNTVQANYYTITPKAGMVLHEYSVRFDPKEKTARDGRYKILRVLQEQIFQGVPDATVATDFRGIIVTAQALNFPTLNDSGDPTGVLAPENPDSKTAVNTKYWIQHTKSHAIDQLVAYLKNPGAGLSNRDEIVKILNIVISRQPSNQAGIVAHRGKNFFQMTQAKQGKPLLLDKTGNFTALYGYSASVRTTTDRLLLNVNAVTAAYVVPKPLLDFKNAYGNDLETFAKTVRSLRVQYELRQTVESIRKKEPFTKRLMTKTVLGLARWNQERRIAGNASATFKLEEDGKTTLISVKDYFERSDKTWIKHLYHGRLIRFLEYGVILKFPNEPLLNIGTTKFEVLYPLELLTTAPGELYKKKLTDAQVQGMIQHACRDPVSVFDSIQKGGPTVLSLHSSRGPNSYGLEISKDLISVQSYLLPSRTVQYKTNGTEASIRPFRGSWNLDGHQVTRKAKFKKWKAVGLGFRAIRIDDGLNMLNGMMVNMNVGTEDPSIETSIVLSRNNKAQQVQKIDNMLKKSVQDRTELLLIVLAERDTALYSILKYRADCLYGIPSVCVVSNFKKFGSLGEASKSYYANVALKINAKMGGLNQSFTTSDIEKGTMIVGIDVTHPAPGSIKETPSIAAVVASIDDLYAQYPASIMAQGSRVERIENLEMMIGERLDLYRDLNPRYPEQILLYRDGVSEGEYLNVLNYEGAAIDNAVKLRYPGKKPKVNIVVVGKRHHTRFFDRTRYRPGPGKDRGNLAPGTVIERGVTMENGFDFFLVAHNAIQGTAKPAHYVVIRNDMGWTAEVAQNTTYALHHMWQRATKVLSICPAVQAAHLACERARIFQKEGYRGTGEAWEDGQAGWTNGVHPNVQRTMFYL